MKYRGMKEIYICLLIPLSALAVYQTVVIFTEWQDCDYGVRAFMLISLCIVVSLLVYFLTCLHRPAAYPEFRSDGLHVVSRQAGELAFIDWMDVKDCREVTYDPMHVTVCVYYTLLILQWDAKFGRNPISMCREYRQADVETIERHRLDDLVNQLAQGTMTAEEFENQPYIFLVSDYKYDRKGYWKPSDKIKKLWKTRRKECLRDEQQPE